MVVHNLYIIILFFVAGIGIPLKQAADKVYSNDDFRITYQIAEEDSLLVLTGSIIEIKNKIKAENVNIWSACPNKDGTVSGTVPNSNGEFKIKVPRTCRKIFFLKYGFKKIELNLNN